MTQLDSYTRVQREALAEVSRDRLTFASKLTPVVTLAGKEYRRKDLLNCSYSGDDGYAMLLDITAKAKLPRNVEQKPVSVAFEADTSKGPVVLPAFEGFALRRRSKGYAILAATGGYEAERVPVGKSPLDDINWRGVRFDTGIGQALGLLRRRYRASEIPVKERPRLYRKDDTRWTWNLYCKELIEWASEQGEVTVADTPTNSMFFYPRSPVSRDAPPAWNFERGVDFDEEVGDETPDGERFYRVVVHSQADDTGNVRKLAEREVDNKGLPVYGGSTFMHALEPETDGESAGLVAANLARELGRNDTDVSVEVNYPPFFLRRGDIVTARDKEYEITSGLEGTLTTYNYLSRVRNISVDALALTGSISGDGMLVGTESRSLSLPDFERQGGYRPLWGTSASGVGFFDTSLPWVRLDAAAGVIYLDEDLAASYGVDLEPLTSNLLEVR